MTPPCYRLSVTARYTYINNKSTLNDASVTPTSQIATTAMLLLHVAEH
jgi:hypothetical protein